MTIRVSGDQGSVAISIADKGVGMDGDYGTAQRMYVKRGYIPDGRGLFFDGHFVKWGDPVTVNDDLVLHFTKRLERREL